MSERVRDTRDMIAGLHPVLRPGTFVFATVPTGASPPPDAIASFAEDEGLSLIRSIDSVPDAGLALKCITLQVHSALDGVGLTAAVSTALADAAIPANVVAANHHDHVFVPEGLAERAIDVLTALQRSARDG